MLGVVVTPLLATSLVSAGTPPTQARAGEPLPGLTASELERWQIGRVAYAAPLSSLNGGPLGPVFNKNNCGNCHSDPLGGPGSTPVTRFGREEKGVFDPLAELGGSLLQSASITPECAESIPAEANVTELRMTNGALAYGLVEAIPDSALKAVRDAQPKRARGLAHMVGAFEDPPGSKLRVGRFGWKAQVATVLTFSADASLNELGLTNRFLDEENAPNGDAVLLAACDTAADPEDGPDAQGFDLIDRYTDFQRFLAPFPQTPKNGMAGEVLFNTIGCAVCHHSSYTTDNNANLEDAIRNKAIRPYSDFLLHQMGVNGDQIVQGDGVQGMVKTPPLWGLATRDPMWHNGSAAGGDFASRVTTAIGLHDCFGSQAAPAAQNFANLPPADQANVVAFLASLGQNEFDVENDGIVAFLDFLDFKACIGSSPTPNDHCAIHDVDQDGDVDTTDFSAFMMLYDGLRRDCNNNGIVDLLDIVSGNSADTNNNAIPDSCEPTCTADITGGGGTVNVNDLLAVINQWGACPALTLPCSGDLDNNHVVNVNDLLAVINSWGTCP